MKKLITLALATMMTMTMIGCGGQTTTEPAEEEKPEAVQEAADAADGTQADTDGKIKIGIDMASRDAFMSSLETAFMEAAKAYPEVEIVAVYDADYDVQKQMEQIDALATVGVDVIIAGLADSNTASEVIPHAQGIPLVLTTRHPDDSVLIENNVIYVGSPESDAGTQQGNFLAEYFKDSGKTELNYVLFMGPLGLENATQRTEYAKKALTDAGYTLNKVFEDTANWDRAEAMSKMQQILGTNQEIDCVIANNDEMALGAVEALKAAGKLEGIPVVGIDATDAGLEAVKNGEMAMTVLQNAVGQADSAMELAVKLAKGETLDDVVFWVPFETITLDNLDQYMK